MNRDRWIFVCICTAVVALALAGAAGASTLPSRPATAGVSAAQPAAASVSAALPLDEFVLAGEVTSSVRFGCTSCLIIDACLNKHKHEACKPSDPRCTCENCNGAFECFR